MRLPMFNPAVASPIELFMYQPVCVLLLLLTAFGFAAIFAVLFTSCLLLVAAVLFLLTVCLLFAAARLCLVAAILLLSATCLLFLAASLFLVAAGLNGGRVSDFLKALHQFFGRCLVGVVGQCNLLPADVCLNCLYALLEAHVALNLVLACLAVHLRICGYDDSLDVFGKTCDGAQRQCQ
jgi:hypothetical protein